MSRCTAAQGEYVRACLHARLLRKLTLVLLMLLMRKTRILVIFVLEMLECLLEMVLRFLHEPDDFALLESRRHCVAPIHTLGDINRDAIMVHPQFLQRVCHRKLLCA